MILLTDMIWWLALEGPLKTKEELPVITSKEQILIHLLLSSLLLGLNDAVIGKKEEGNLRAITCWRLLCAPGETHLQCTALHHN